MELLQNYKDDNVEIISHDKFVRVKVCNSEITLNKYHGKFALSLSDTLLAALAAGPPYTPLIRLFSSEDCEQALPRGDSSIYCDYDLGNLYFDVLNIDNIKYFGPHRQQGTIFCGILIGHAGDLPNLKFICSEYHCTKGKVSPNIVYKNINILVCFDSIPEFEHLCTNLQLLVQVNDYTRRFIAELVYTKNEYDYVVIENGRARIHSKKQLTLPDHIIDFEGLKCIFTSR